MQEKESCWGLYDLCSELSSLHAHINPRPLQALQMVRVCRAGCIKLQRREYSAAASLGFHPTCIVSSAGVNHHYCNEKVGVQNLLSK